MSETTTRPARLQHARDLGEDGRLVGHQVDHAVAGDGVDAPSLDRQPLEPSLPEVDVGHAGLRRRGTRALQHLGRHVHSDHAPRAPHLFRAMRASRPGPGAEVHHGLARLELQVTERHPAAQAEVGFFGTPARSLAE
jgi:hypothetical protein